MAEEFGDGGEGFPGHGVETSLCVEKAVGGEDMEMGMKDEVIAKGVDGSGSGDAATGHAEACAEGIAQALCGGLEEEVEEVSAFAEDAAQHFGEREDELAVGDFVADGCGDPCAGLACSALMAGRAEVAGLAGECEELFVAAIGALEAGEACGEVAAPEKGADGVDGIRAERPHGGAVVLFVGGNEGVSCRVDDLPEVRSARAARMVDRGHHGSQGWVRCQARDVGDRDPVFVW